MTLEIGSLLYNRYRIEQIIAHGGMGAIYRATDESLGVFVAIKENLYPSDESSWQFRREATILANLRHPNLPRVTDHYVIPGQGQYLVMDFIEGDDLRKIIDAQGPLGEQEVIRIGTAVCDALSLLHGRQPPIIHRDIKPGNIKVTPTGQVYLVDFGLAKITQQGKATTVGAQALTPGYAPPEQYGQGTEPRSDIYSLGATLYAALTGVIPEDAMGRAMGSANLTPIRQRNPRISDSLARVIEQAMEITPERRFQTVESFKRALFDIGTGLIHGVESEKTTLTPMKPADPTVRAQPQSFDQSQTTPGVKQSQASWQIPSQPPITSYPPQDQGFKAPSQPQATIPPPPLPTPPAQTIPPVVNYPPPPPPYTPPTPYVEKPSEPVSRPKPKRKFPVVPVVILGIIIVGLCIVGALYGLGGGVNKLIKGNEPAIATATIAPTEKSTVQPVKTATFQPTVKLKPTQADTPTTAPTIASNAVATPRGGGTGQIIFTSTRSGKPQIWISNQDGKNLKQLTDMADGACEPAWSPDGKQFVFVSPCKDRKDTYPGSGLFMANADGSGINPLVSLPGGDFEPNWSPDGSQIVFTSIRDQFPHIYLQDLKSNQVTRLSSPSTYDHHPKWSPDGKRIAFDTTRLGGAQVWTMSNTGKDAKEFSNFANGASIMPSWSPKGDVMIFVQGKDTPWITAKQIGVPAAPEVKIPNMYPAWDPSFSPDGFWMTFESTKDGPMGIYIVNSAGGNLTRLPSATGIDFDPAWKPGVQ